MPKMLITTQIHILPYDVILHPLTNRAIVFTRTVPSRVRAYCRAEVEHGLLQEDLDVHRRLLYEKILKVYKEQKENKEQEEQEE